MLINIHNNGLHKNKNKTLYGNIICEMSISTYSLTQYNLI